MLTQSPSESMNVTCFNFVEQTNFFSSQCAQQALEDMCSYLADDGEVAIFDATNTTRDRRQCIYEYCTQTFCFRVFFVESICDSLEIIGANIRVCIVDELERRINIKLFFLNRK